MKRAVFHVVLGLVALFAAHGAQATQKVIPAANAAGTEFASAGANAWGVTVGGGQQLVFYGRYTSTNANESGLGLKIAYDATKITNVAIDQVLTKCMLFTPDVTVNGASSQVLFGWADTSQRVDGAVGWPSLADGTPPCINPPPGIVTTTAGFPAPTTLFRFTATTAGGFTSGTSTIAVTSPSASSATGASSFTNTSLVVNGIGSNPNLSSLVLSAGTLSPAFASGTTSYTASVANGVTSITVTPTVADATASVKVNNVTVASGNPSGAIGLNVGSNTIDVVVTAQDGTTSKTYTVGVTRAAGVSAPTVTTNAATGVTAGGATLNGTVSSNGASTTVTFEYGLTASYGNTATAAQSPLGAGATGTAVAAAIGGLGCGTTYHYRAVGVNSVGTTNGGDATVTTAACDGTGFAPGVTAIGSAANLTPSIVTTLPVTCPASGAVLVSGSGESAAVSSKSGTAFIGLAYSIARDSYATDNTNVVQSSALAIFNGDTNRDFLNVQRVDSCTPGATNTYRLTVYRTSPDTSSGSFVWNGRLTASVPLSLPGTGFAAGLTGIGSAVNATPTIIAALPVTCPAAGAVLVSGSGESAAVSSNGGTAFIGVAYSVSRDNPATDNTNVVQSSALAIFNGDTNRDFLNVQRVDSCAPGTTYLYRLTAYRTTPDTSTNSFVWNGRLTASVPLSLPGTGFAAGVTAIGSAVNATPTTISTLSLTCPASGKVLVAGSGESAAISSNSSTAFIGIAYSVSRDSLATDNGNVVQSSALAIFNGDANRDFLNVQRVENCTPGITSTYRLTAYRTTADTSASSFVWNGRLAATALP